MQSGVRRLVPAIVFVLVGGLAVWVASPESLTGSADGAGCAGAPLTEVQSEALEQEDPGAAQAVAGLIKIPGTVFRTDKEAVEVAIGRIKDMGEVAIPSVIKGMQSEGIDSPAGLELTRLVAGAMAETTYDANVVEAAVNVALNNIIQAGADAGTQVSIAGFPDLIDQAAGGMNAGQINEGYDSLLGDVAGVEAIDSSSLDEAIAHSLAIVRYGRPTMSEQAGVDVDNRALDFVTNLEATAAIGVPLIIDLTRTLPETAEYGQRLFEITLQEDRLAPIRAIACEGARVRGIDMTPLFTKPVNTFDAKTARCVLRAAMEQAHIDFAEATTKHKDPTARVAGWHTLSKIGQQQHALDALDVALNRQGETDYEPSLTERIAALDAVLAIGLLHVDSQPTILEQLPADGIDEVTATWVDAIRTGFEGVE
jgi:hypothetical protein